MDCIAARLFICRLPTKLFDPMELQGQYTEGTSVVRSAVARWRHRHDQRIGSLPQVLLAINTYLVPLELELARSSNVEGSFLFLSICVAHVLTLCCCCMCPCATVLLCPTARGSLGSVTATAALLDEWRTVLGTDLTAAGFSHSHSDHSISSNTISNITGSSNGSGGEGRHHAVEFVAVSVSVCLSSSGCACVCVPATTQSPLPPSVERYVRL